MTCNCVHNSVCRYRPTIVETCLCVIEKRVGGIYDNAEPIYKFLEMNCKFREVKEKQEYVVPVMEREFDNIPPIIRNVFTDKNLAINECTLTSSEIIK